MISCYATIHVPCYIILFIHGELCAYLNRRLTLKQGAHTHTNTCVFAYTYIDTKRTESDNTFYLYNHLPREDIRRESSEVSQGHEDLIDRGTRVEFQISVERTRRIVGGSERIFGAEMCGKREFARARRCARTEGIRSTSYRSQ